MKANFGTKNNYGTYYGTDLIWNLALVKQAISSLLTSDGDCCPSGEQEYKPLGGISIDSRTIEKNQIFLALKGKNFDASHYIKQAIEKGASCIITQAGDKPSDSDFSGCSSGGDINIPIFRVADALLALKQLASFKRAKLHELWEEYELCQAKPQGDKHNPHNPYTPHNTYNSPKRPIVIAVTGSIGKTSLKEVLRQIFRLYGKTYANSGNYNNHIGMPLSLANVGFDAKYIILEMGMNHQGEILELSKIAKPDVAIITSVEEVHIEFLHTIENIAKAKAEIFAGLNLKRNLCIGDCPAEDAILTAGGGDVNGVIILPKSVRCKEIILQEGKKLAPHADILQIETGYSKLQGRLQPRLQSRLQPLRPPQDPLEVNLKLATELVKYLKLDETLLAKNAASFQAAEGRGKISILNINQKQIIFYDDSYNSSPRALRNAILNFAHQITKPEATKPEPKPEPAKPKPKPTTPEATGASERAMLIIGGMQELGEETPKHHQEAAKFIADNIGLFANKPQIILLGSLCEYMFDALPDAKYFPSADAILRYFNSNQEAFHNINAIFVKGSHSTGAYKIAKFLLQYRAKQQD